MTILEVLNNAMTDRKNNGDFESYKVVNLTEVLIEVETGRNYRLHQNEINHIIKTELDSLKEYVDQLVPTV